jgi:RHS repeat-associated protein
LGQDLTWAHRAAPVSTGIGRRAPRLPSWAQTWWVSSTSNRSLDAVDANGLPVLDPETRFDAAGQPVALSHLRALDWSWRGCLTRAVTIARADGPVDDGERYTYGADRVRVRKLSTRLVVGGADPVVETREVVYLGEQERIRVRRGDTLVLERWTTHVSDGERRVATLDRHVVDTLGAEVDALGPTQVRYHLTTPQGSTAVELAADGRLITYEEYLPHGGSAFLAGDDAREVSRRDVRYAGKERDRATGLHAYPQRYYAPWLGRWLTPDPIGPAGGLNLYEFVSGDPIGYVDPDGTDRESIDRLPSIRERTVEPMPWTASDGGGKTWTFDEQAAWYRAHRSEGRVRVFDSVSREEQVQHLTQGHALVDHIDPNDSSSPAGTLTPEAYEDWKLFRQAHLANKGEQLTVAVPASPAESVTVKNGLGEIETPLAGNRSFESQYQAVHEYTTYGPLAVDTITSGLGGMGLGRNGGHAQFRVIDLSVGGMRSRDYQVFAGLFSYSETSYRWQSIPFETFEHFRNVNNAYEQDPFGWRDATGYDNPTWYFTDVLSQQAIGRERFQGLMRSLQREIAKFAIRMIPLVGEYEAGVALGEALRGRESGMSVDAAVDGHFGQLGRPLSGWERGFRALGAVVTACGLSTQYAAQLRQTRQTARAVTPARPTISASRAAAIAQGYGSLSQRQVRLLERLPSSLSRVELHKRAVKMNDLAALTAATGDEFAVFTRGSKRLVVRGDMRGVGLSVSELAALRDGGWRWSGHTHPGTGDIVLDASGRPGDRAVLDLLAQGRSLILNSRGARSIFDGFENVRVPMRGSQ